jgi:hypothetical protein
MTVAHEIKVPWRKYKNPRNEFEKDYRESFITIWHNDPEKDGTDDSCGWFPRSRHGNSQTLEAIISRFEFNWDSSFISDSTGEPVFYGYFIPVTGEPRMSPQAIVLGLFQHAAIAVLGKDGGDWEPAQRFMQRNLFRILLFAENPTDSIHDSIVQKYGPERNREERMRSMAACIYGWILRAERPWWKHPRWHVWHWRIQVHPWQRLRRKLFDRCESCGKSFQYGESPVSHSWSHSRPAPFRSARNLYHEKCSMIGPAQNSNVR